MRKWLIAATAAATLALAAFMLAALGLQTAGGLFGNDDIAFQGPLYALVSKDTSDWLSGLHRKGFWLILLLVLTHLGAIVFYLRVHRDNLVLIG